MVCSVRGGLVVLCVPSFLQGFASCERVKGEESMEEEEGEHVSRFSHAYVAHDSAMHDSKVVMCTVSSVPWSSCWLFLAQNTESHAG